MGYVQAKIAMKVAERFAAQKLDVPPDFQGNPEVHGIDKPVGGGFSIMQNLQKKLVKEEVQERKKQERKREQEEEKIEASVKTAKKKDLRTTVWDNHGNVFKAWLEDGHDGPVLTLQEKTGSTAGKWSWYVASLMGLDSGRRIGDRLDLDSGQNWYVTGMKKLMNEIEDSAIKMVPVIASHREMQAAVKQAMYWCSPGRTYRMTKQEQESGQASCPRCKGQMEKERFTRSEKMFRCPNCGFKVPSGSVTTQKIEIEIEPNGEVEIEIGKEASARTAGVKTIIVTKGSNDRRKMLQWLKDLRIRPSVEPEGILVGEEVFKVKTKRGRTIIDALEQMARQGKIELNYV
jgi:predicted RNA-binding Zn-ribbon protein involved in translation (DUF1610 family)